MIFKNTKEISFVFKNIMNGKFMDIFKNEENL